MAPAKKGDEGGGGGEGGGESDKANAAQPPQPYRRNTENELGASRPTPWADWDEWRSLKQLLTTGQLRAARARLALYERRRRNGVPFAVHASVALASLLAASQAAPVNSSSPSSSSSLLSLPNASDRGPDASPPGETAGPEGGGSATLAAAVTKAVVTVADRDSDSIPPSPSPFPASLPAEEVAAVAMDDYLRRHALAMALVRLVNAATDRLQPRAPSASARSVHSLAVVLRLPPLLVEMRHLATHNALPKLPVLETAARQALVWLDAEYWHPQELAVRKHLHPTLRDVADVLHDNPDTPLAAALCAKPCHLQGKPTAPTATDQQQQQQQQQQKSTHEEQEEWSEWGDVSAGVESVPNHLQNGGDAGTIHKDNDSVKTAATTLGTAAAVAESAATEKKKGSNIEANDTAKGRDDTFPKAVTDDGVASNKSAGDHGLAVLQQLERATVLAEAILLENQSVEKANPSVTDGKTNDNIGSEEQCNNDGEDDCEMNPPNDGDEQNRTGNSIDRVNGDASADDSTTSPEVPTWVRNALNPALGESDEHGAECGNPDAWRNTPIGLVPGQTRVPRLPVWLGDGALINEQFEGPQKRHRRPLPRRARTRVASQVGNDVEEAVQRKRRRSSASEHDPLTTKPTPRSYRGNKFTRQQSQNESSLSVEDMATVDKLAREFCSLVEEAR